ncbi:MAG: MotA/TolQ/ExbB proton channel family protein [Candidatus Cloacimonas sp.]|jgi:biopolymer transport protein ExbB/TolQ|nr:MotA/TolQ/ExbB proton channel family protein [Candidatus Cloacimonadota bacterium]
MKKFILSVVGVFAGFSLFAQEAGSVSLVELYSSGGLFSHLIALLFLCAIVYGVVRFIQLAVKEKLDAKAFYLKLKGYIKNESYEEAIKVSGNFKNTTLGYIFWSGLSVFNDQRKSGVKGRDLKNALQNSFDEAGLQTIYKLDAGLFWFDIIAQVATLLGLLGTIWGLMVAFKGLAVAAPVDQQRILTQGIQQAMGTTALGLSAAIPTMFIKGYLSSKSEKIINDIDEYSVKMINQINSSIKE